MAMSACPKCDGNHFEIKTIEPRGCNYKENLVQCTSCGVVVGVLEYYNVGSLVKDQEKEITKLQRAVASIQSDLNTLDHNIRVIAKAVGK